MKIYHWWPGRKWSGPCPIPEEAVQEAERTGSRYMTVAKVETERGPVIWGIARCCPRDVPDKRIGREIAEGRALKAAAEISKTAMSKSMAQRLVVQKGIEGL